MHDSNEETTYELAEREIKAQEEIERRKFNGYGKD